MSSMITICPGCGRKGIMAKATGKCFHCNKGNKPKVTIAAPGATVTAPSVSKVSPPHRKPKRKPKTPRVVGGRLVRG